MTNPFAYNPFDEEEQTEDNNDILEGFLCPICREDLRSLEGLTSHFEKSHADEQDALKSIFKDIFSIAKKKIGLNFDEIGPLSEQLENKASISGFKNEQQLRAEIRKNAYEQMRHQTIGRERDLLPCFQAERNPRLERYASETNKILIRLHKLMTNMPVDPVMRKQHEKSIVAWLDGSSVKLCPNCARSFHFARRQHHCRLCGTIMCQDCSQFLAMEAAEELSKIIMSQSELESQQKTNANAAASNSQQYQIRACDHCLRLMQNRLDMHESRTCFPKISQIYADIQKLRAKVMPDIDMYSKIIASLYEGESFYTIADASALFAKIGEMAEIIDLHSKRIMQYGCEEGSREEQLKKAVRLSCIQLIKGNMLSLPPLPSEEEIRKIQQRKRNEAEQRIAYEKLQAQKAYERNAAFEVMDKTDYVGSSEGASFRTDLRSLNNWSAIPVNSSNIPSNLDPLTEQINIIKGFIKQAKQDMNFEVVETLESNLRELQREYYQRQQYCIPPEDGNALSTNNHF